MIKHKNVIISLLVLSSYCFMIIMNMLANILPLNGKNTGEISDSYGNLFAPAGITFAIWGLIYLLLFVYIVYQFWGYLGIARGGKSERIGQILNHSGIWFSISSVANALWILAWHYDVIWLSLLFTLCILGCLIKINLGLRNESLSRREHVAVRLPFTVYLGWATVATIANMTVLLVSVSWNRFSLSEVFWTASIVMIGAVIGCLGVFFYKSYAYGAVLLWAYAGIVLKHLSPEQFNGKYPAVILAVLVSILGILISMVVLFYRKRKTKK